MRERWYDVFMCSGEDVRLPSAERLARFVGKGDAIAYAIWRASTAPPHHWGQVFKVYSSANNGLEYTAKGVTTPSLMDQVADQWLKDHE